MRRSLILALVPALFLVISCGDDAENPGGAFESTSTSTSTTGEVPPDMPAETGTDSATGDGDGDPATGDGDGEPAGDGDGDPTTTTGDGDGDPTTTGGNQCGNGVVDVGEQCDSDDLNGFTCEDLGYDGGMLACDPVNCTYDASGCMNGGGEMGGGTTG